MSSIFIKKNKNLLSDKYIDAAKALQEIKDDDFKSADKDRQISKIVDAMEKTRVAEYAMYLYNPIRLLWMNFLIGLARGLGGTLGLSLVLTFMAVVLKNVIDINLPLINDWLRELISAVLGNVQDMNHNP